jgi:hypothetical protein
MIAGTKLLGAVENPTVDVLRSTEIAVGQQAKELGVFKHKYSKEYNKETTFSSIETDNGDFDFQEHINLVSTVTKVLACVIFIHFVLYAYRRRRSFYTALIQLFDYKYIVYRTLRI